MRFLYVFWGKVVQGKRRGKELGYPTANIPLHKKIPEGIYISQARISGNLYPALTFIGSAQTFGEFDVKSETYLLSQNQNLYGKWISIGLLKKIRGNQKFQSTSLLVAQMKEDEKKAREYFKI